MNYASSDLINEHEGILLGLVILGRMTERLKGGDSAVGDNVADIMVFFALFADACHHGKEEGILFPEMERVGIARENGPIGQMLAEHETGRAYIREMKRASEGPEIDVAAFADFSAKYIALLRSHIEKENKVLFPMGDKLIPSSRQEELLGLFDLHEKNAMGEGVHEGLHSMLKGFQEKYLR